MDKDERERPIQYWLTPPYLKKSGEKGRWLDEKNTYIKPTLFGRGSLFVNEAYVAREGWDLDSVTNIKLFFDCECVPTNRRS